MYLMSHMSSRNQLPQFLNERGLTKVAIEVGTHRGQYAEIFLSQWIGGKLHCVDPWETADDYSGQEKFLELSDGDRAKDHAECIKNLSRFEDRVEIHKMTSMEFARKARRDGIKPDFVYLDGNHKPPHVEWDIKTWWEILRPGGVLAGHDIVMTGDDREDNWGRHIQPVVQTYFRNYEVSLIVEEGSRPWTYYVVKGGC